MCEKNSKIINNSLVENGEESKVVVITVWYNRAEHVKDSIESLINQTMDDYLIFAVDDGSTDGTGSMLEEMLFEAESCNVPMRVWRKSNEGFVSSLKQAIEKESKNDIIALHGAGDLSYPARLQTQYTLLENNDQVIATGVGVEKIDSDRNYLGKKTWTEWPSSDPFAGTVPRLGTHGASMYYRDNYEQSGGYRTHFVYAQDTDLLMRLRECGKFLNSNTVLYSKLVSDKTVSSNSDWKQNLEQIIYSAAALESARQRKLGEPDPIENIDPDDWLGIKNVAKQNGVHIRAIKKCVLLMIRSVKRGEFIALLTIISFLGIRGVLSILLHFPYFVIKKMDKIWAK